MNETQYRLSHTQTAPNMSFRQSVNASDKETIKNAVFSLQACGGTNGYDGINKAYELAEKNLKDGNNRIILCTDGDFDTGPFFNYRT